MKCLFNHRYGAWSEFTRVDAVHDNVEDPFWAGLGTVHRIVYVRVKVCAKCLKVDTDYRKIKK